MNVQPLEKSLEYADVDLAAVYETRTHTVSAEDVATFGDLTFDHHPLHTDDSFARAMGFERRIAHGLYGLSLMEGLKAELGLYTTTSVASLGWDKVRFVRPLYVEDTVRSRIRFIAKRPSRNPARGVVTEAVDLVRDDGEVVISGEHATLLALPDNPPPSRPDDAG